MFEHPSTLPNKGCSTGIDTARPSRLGWRQQNLLPVSPHFSGQILSQLSFCHILQPSLVIVKKFLFLFFFCCFFFFRMEPEVVCHRIVFQCFIFRIRNVNVVQVQTDIFHFLTADGKQHRTGIGNQKNEETKRQQHDWSNFVISEFSKEMSHT